MATPDTPQLFKHLICLTSHSWPHAAPVIYSSNLCGIEAARHRSAGFAFVIFIVVSDDRLLISRTDTGF